MKMLLAQTQWHGLPHESLALPSCFQPEVRKQTDKVCWKLIPFIPIVQQKQGDQIAWLFCCSSLYLLVKYRVFINFSTTVTIWVVLKNFLVIFIKFG